MNNLAIGIVKMEKAQLDLLAAQVTEAQYEVNELQANVSALEGKSSQFNIFLQEADANRASALDNQNQAIDINTSSKSLCDSTILALKQAVKAAEGIKSVSADMAVLIEKLILTVELIDRFSLLVNKQKAGNPLIPDSLVSCMAKAGTDASNAIALTLTALQSCYAAEATSLRCKKVLELQSKHAVALHHRIEHPMTDDGFAKLIPVGMTPDAAGLLYLSKQAYGNARDKYNEALNDNNMVNKQLAHAKQMLAVATTSLSSYQAGLAAATAAAYAA